MTENPFYYNQPVQPKDFVGRRSLVTDIANDLVRFRADSWAIIGGRRFGKSSVLKALEHELQLRLNDHLPRQRAVLPVVVDLKGSETENEQKVYARILQLLYRTLERNPLVATPLAGYVFRRAGVVSYYSFEEELEQLRMQLEKAIEPVRLVLLLDEVESIIKFPWSETLLNQLRAMIYDGPLADTVKLVLTGSAQVVQVRHEGSPLLNALKVVHLEVFDPAGFEELVKRGGRISEGTLNKIRILAGGHPFIAQYLLHYLFEIGLESATESVVDQIGSQMRQTRLSDFEGWWRAVGRSGQEAYQILSQHRAPVHENELLTQLRPETHPDQGLSALCYHGLARYNRVTRQYECTSQIFQDWYRINVASSIPRIPQAELAPQLHKEPTGQPFIFISYSHKDRIWKDKLQSQLSVLEVQGDLSVWEDRQINVGDDWYAQINKAIEYANVAILLISADFLTSRFILGEEVPRLLKKRVSEGLRIIPVIVRPCAWQNVTWLASIQCFPSEGRALSGGTEFQIESDLAELVSQIAKSLN